MGRPKGKSGMSLTIVGALTYILFRFQALILPEAKGISLAFFITFEGIEGSGKTTQIRRLKKYLLRKNVPCRVTREPGGGPIGDKIRKILLDPLHGDLIPLSELLLYEAARVQHVHEVIKPLLKGRGVILCDRFSDASTAYQGYGRKIHLALVEQLNRIATQGVRPDITFLLDCPADTGLRRAIRRNRDLHQEGEGRFEAERIQFHRRVRRGYLAIARKEPRRVKIIDTRQGEEKVFEKICQIIDERIIGSKGLKVQPEP